MTTKREELTVRVTYEPNRFSSHYLTDAYAVIAPLINLPLSAVPSVPQDDCEELAIDYEGEIV